jgi:hypothetical protein
MIVPLLGSSCHLQAKRGQSSEAAKASHWPSRRIGLTLFCPGAYHSSSSASGTSALTRGDHASVGIRPDSHAQASVQFRADQARPGTHKPRNSGITDTLYELAGTAFTMAELAAEVSKQTGNHIVYQDLPVEQYAEALAAAGVPEALADLVADTSLAIAHGDWYSYSTDLHQLIGRPSTPLAEAVAVALKPSD